MATLDLSQYGIKDVKNIIHNPSYEELYKDETNPNLEGYEKGITTDLGAVDVFTGVYTGRSPKDKYLVKDEVTENTVWWTSEEYEKWILEQKKEMESLIGSNDGWYDGQGIFHGWTQESVDAIIAKYYQILDSIKSGTLYSKDTGDDAGYAMMPPSDDVECSYGTDIIKEDGKTIHLGDYSTKEELDQAIKKAVESGQLTEQEAKDAYLQ